MTAGDPQAAIPHQSLAAVFVRFLRFGCLAWGGPVAQIAMIQRELVEEERWISRERFRGALAVYQVLPGPEAHELCVYFGMLARGRTGAVLAGLGFMLPGFLLMLGVSALYANGTLQTAALRPVFVGLQAAVLAVIARALVRIAHHTLDGLWLWTVAVLSCAATMTGVHFAIALAFGGGSHLLWRSGRRVVALLAAALFVCWAVYQWQAGAPPPGLVDGPAAATPPTTPGLFASGLRCGLLTFGGAYTAIPFLQQDAVVTGGWMSNDQFLEGIALAGVLPAPLIIFGTFVGYVGCGFVGALAMTAGIFLPAFCFTLVGHGLFERITGNRRVREVLDGITAAVVGIMAATTISLLQTGVTDWRSGVIVGLGFVLLWFWSGRAAVPMVVVSGGALGWALS